MPLWPTVIVSVSPGVTTREVSYDRPPPPPTPSVPDAASPPPPPPAMATAEIVVTQVGTINEYTLSVPPPSLPINSFDSKSSNDASVI